MLDHGAGEPRPKKGSKKTVDPDRALERAAGLSAEQVPSSPLPPTGPEAPAPKIGGCTRPWMTFGEKLQSRTLVEDAGVMLWEGGTKTTVELKREILDLLDQMDSLVAVVDLKNGERPDEPQWWPSLAVVHAWVEEDPFFAKAIDRWRHARQERLLEALIWDLHAGNELSKGQLEILKLRLKFGSTVLPRTVNKGMREKVDVETTSNHLHLHAGLSDEALQEKLAALRRNPRVQELLSLQTDDGNSPVLVGGSVLPPALPPAAAPMPIQDQESLSRALMGQGDGL